MIDALWSGVFGIWGGVFGISDGEIWSFSLKSWNSSSLGPLHDFSKESQNQLGFLKAFLVGNLLYFCSIEAERTFARPVCRYTYKSAVPLNS